LRLSSSRSAVDWLALEHLTVRKNVEFGFLLYPLVNAPVRIRRTVLLCMHSIKKISFKLWRNINVARVGMGAGDEPLGSSLHLF
jgi:hypothetical protein